MMTDDQCENPQCRRLFLPEDHLVTHDERHFCDWACHYEWEIANGYYPSYEIEQAVNFEIGEGDSGETACR